MRVRLVSISFFINNMYAKSTNMYTCIHMINDSFIDDCR